MFKQYIKLKNITALLTDCNISTNTAVHTVKITHRTSIGVGPTDTVLIRNLRTTEIYLS